MPAFPSISTIIAGIFLAYMGYSILNMIQLFNPPSCPQPSKCIHPYIQVDTEFQFIVYTSVKRYSDVVSDFTFLYNVKAFDCHRAHEEGVNITLPKSVRSNGTLFMHLFLTKKGINAKNIANIARDPKTISVSYPLTQYEVPQPKSFNLLGDEKEHSRITSKNRPVTHIQSVVVFNVLTEPILLPRDGIPHEIGRLVKLTEGKYLPFLNVDVLAMRMRDLVEVTPSTETATLTMKYTPVTYGKLRMCMEFVAALDSMKSFGFSNKDIDEVKGIFTDSNLYFLCITFVVASLHMVFDFLAFKNDIHFWRSLDNMGGISPSTVAWRCFSQIVIFLYLMEEDTSLLVLVPSAVGAIIELWKVTKAFHIELSGWKLEVKGALTAEENSTKQLDSQGFKYLSYLLYPIIVIGAIYSLLYIPHKSWYSWLINSLVNGVYGFGFLFMLPQLFINYKLKSVAHLPWRAFMYKAFNTFIDDLFAFIITMPTAHRVACFRDDVVFIIYLYQRWLYPVDKKRVNEFGQKGDESDKDHQKQE